MPQLRKINENSIKYFNFNATSLHQPKGLNWNTKKKNPPSPISDHYCPDVTCTTEVNFSKRLLTSIFEASDEVLMMRPTTYFFIPCNETNIKETLLACTNKNENTSCHDMFIAKPSRACSLLHLVTLATEILRGPKFGHIQ